MSILAIVVLIIGIILIGIAAFRAGTVRVAFFPLGVCLVLIAVFILPLVHA